MGEATNPGPKNIFLRKRDQQTVLDRVSDDPLIDRGRFGLLSSDAEEVSSRVDLASSAHAEIPERVSMPERSQEFEVVEDVAGHHIDSSIRWRVCGAAEVVSTPGTVGLHDSGRQ